MNTIYSFEIITSVLRLFNIRYTINYVQKLLDENSDGDNLWGILNVLQIYGLKVEPRRLTDPNTILYQDVTCPFITEYEGNIVVIDQITESSYMGILNRKRIIYNKEIFLHDWSGLMVSIHPGETVGEPNLQLHIRERRITLSIILSIAVGVLVIYSCQKYFFNGSLYSCLIFLLSAIGLFITYQIDLSINIYHTFLTSLCSIFKASSCTSFSRQKNAYLTILGSSYFASVCAFLLLPLNSFSIINILNVFAIGEVVYSLLVQSIRRAFCIGCVAIQCIVIAMALLSIYNLTRETIAEWHVQAMYFISIYTIILSAFLFFKLTYLSQRTRLRICNREMDSLKKQYLEKTIPLDSNIIVYLNPLCSPCKDELINAYNLLINTQHKIVPIVIASDARGERAGISILDGNNPKEIIHRLREWYLWGYRRPTDFENKFKVSSNDKKRLANELKSNLICAQKHDVYQTPSIICNDVKLATGITLVDVLTN